MLFAQENGCCESAHIVVLLSELVRRKDIKVYSERSEILARNLSPVLCTPESYTHRGIVCRHLQSLRLRIETRVRPLRMQI